MDEKQRKRFEFWKNAAEEEISTAAFNIEARYPDEESTSPEYRYVNNKYKEALEILKWLQKKSEE